MNYKQLKELAKKGALVRWSPSGAVEQLRWSKNGAVQAINLVTKKEHMLGGFKEYRCVEVLPDELVSVGSLLPVRSGKKHKQHFAPFFKTHVGKP